MSFSIFASADPEERRRTRRARCAKPVEVRQQGRFAVPAQITDITARGCRISGSGPFVAGFPMSVQLSAEGWREARIVWSDFQESGIRFERALEDADFGGLAQPRPQLRVVD